MVGVAASYTTAVLLYAIGRRRRTEGSARTLGIIAFVSALIGTVCASMGFVIEYAVGGAAPTSLSSVAAYMFGTHALKGLTPEQRRGLFWIVFAFATLLIAGGVSYLASSSPDGLDSATLRGCRVVETNGTEELIGECIAQNAGDHAMAGSPLADYAIDDRDGTGGLAGIIGAIVTVVVAGAVFWLIARTRSKPSFGG